MPITKHIKEINLQLEVVSVCLLGIHTEKRLEAL